MSSLVPSSAPKPRVCHLRKWPDFNGYGFNLHAESGKAGQYIGKVDEGSPAEVCGMKEGDRIVEVNATNIGNENHQQVVQRIKAVADETKLLVVDQEADEYYKEKKIVIRGDMANVMVYTCPATRGEPDVSTITSSSGDIEITPAPTPDASEPQTKEPSGTSAAPPSSDEDSSYHPRLCHLKIWPDFNGYGFNLHAEKGKPGQFIGKVDNDSPSDAAGLREGDRILEVNGVPVASESHGGVVQNIKSNANETKLLVVDPDTDRYFLGRGVTVTGGMKEVTHITCPDTSSEGRSTPSTAPVSPTPSATDGAAHSARLCILRIWPDFAGYGFNMHAEKGKPGQYIGQVDQGSPAEAAGLKEGDRLIEVNGSNVEQEGHQGVVQLIKSEQNETRLLVVDPDADAFFKGKGVAVVGGGAYVNTITCPDRSTSVNGDVTEVNHEPAVSQIAAKSEPTPAPEPSKPAAKPVVMDGIEFAATAKEARERMSRKKKSDPRQSTISMKDKFDLFQRL